MQTNTTMGYPLIIESIKEKAKNNEVVHLANSTKEVVTTQLQFTSAPQIGTGENPDPTPTKNEVVLLTGDQTIAGIKTFTSTISGTITSATNATSATTQSSTDSSTKIATTAFVKTAVSGKSKVSVSSSGSSTSEVSYITVDNTEYKLAGGGGSGDYLPLSGGTLTGNLKTKGEFGTVGTISSSYAVDLSTGTVFYITHQSYKQKKTFSFINCMSSSVATFHLIITNGGCSTFYYPSNIYWDNGVVPDLAVSGTDILSFMTKDGGTTWYGILTASNVATV